MNIFERLRRKNEIEEPENFYAQSGVDANVYKDLCLKADSMMKEPDGADAGNGWIKIKNSPKMASNFKAVVYQKGDQYAIAHVGTNKWSFKDHAANLKMGLTGDSRQIRNAKEFAASMIKEYGLTPENTLSLGHSEGATEATHVGAENGFKTYTFNAYGAYKKNLPQGVDYDNLVTNFRDPHDPVSKLHANVGKTYITPSTQNAFMSRTPFGSLQSHGISNMGDCNKAIPVNYYKRKNQSFLDEISDTEITREDIGQMSPDMFKVYEAEIDERLRNNRIFPASYYNLKRNLGY